MAWNISTITLDANDILQIRGFNTNDRHVLNATIIKTTMDYVLQMDPNFRSNEGTAISYVHASEVYVIDTFIEENADEVINMKMDPYVSANASVFNGVPLMGLPLVTFATFQGLINIPLF